MYVCVMQHCSRMGVCVRMCVYAARLTDGCVCVCVLCSTAHGWVCVCMYVCVMQHCSQRGVCVRMCVLCIMQHCSRMGVCMCVRYAALLTDGCVLMLCRWRLRLSVACQVPNYLYTMCVWIFLCISPGGVKIARRQACPKIGPQAENDHPPPKPPS